MRIPRKHFPPGAVREMRHYSIDDPYAWRWDFAWQDPASGHVTQYGVDARAAPDMPEADFAKCVRGPAIACLEREVHHKCGMDYAIKNQYPLSLPRTACVGRFV